MKNDDPMVEAAAELFRESRKILIFTGAGMSTESGIPDFRSPGGIWSKYDPSDFLYQRIISDEGAREKYWKMSAEYYETMKHALPSPGHLAIKELEDMGKLLSVVTQNIDNLHQKAGNSVEKIIEIHGTAFSVSCLSCGKRYERDLIEERLKSGDRVPACNDCSGVLKPDTISFGQAMPQDKVQESLRLARECDLCLVLGSSLVVYPAASIPAYAVEHGARLVIVNRDETPLDGSADLVIHESVGAVLPRIVESLRH
jgi:NAD-dependent deacetylase